MNSKQLGKLGEGIAQGYLENKGYKILDKNYSFRIAFSPQKGEIDIIAKKQDTICFVEVKTLKKGFFPISPEEKVNFSKQRKLIKTAETWLTKNKIPLNKKWQIDVVGIIIYPDSDFEKPEIRHFENCFSCCS